MGCTSSSLKGSDPNRNDLNNQDQPNPRIVVSETTDDHTKSVAEATAINNTDQSKKRQSTTSSSKFNKASFSLSNPRPKPKPLSDEEFQRATGMTREELQAWGDREVLKGTAKFTKADAGRSPLAGGWNSMNMPGGSVGGF